MRLDAGDPDAFDNRGIAYRAKGEYDLAIADYDAALR
ncbi:tetratricopeptide repeat protein, partial [Pseudomonas aeruginosa]